MPEVRFSVPGVPPSAAKGITAFAPHFNRFAASGAQDYKYAVTGLPGTRGVPVPARDYIPEGHYTGQAQMGTSRSSDAPDAIYPNLYYERFIAERPGGNAPQPRVYQPQFPGRTTLLPVPAEDGRAVYQAQSAALARAAVLNRQGQVPVYPRLYMPPSGTFNG